MVDVKVNDDQGIGTFGREERYMSPDGQWTTCGSTGNVLVPQVRFLPTSERDSSF